MKVGDGFVVEAEMEGTRVAPDTTSVHTPTMTLKNAALLELVGTILMTEDKANIITAVIGDCRAGISAQRHM
jgi:hypothetical protein